MTGDREGGEAGLGGDRADVGFIGDDPTIVFYLPASNTSAVLQLYSTSNVGKGGLWLFEVGSAVMMACECVHLCSIIIIACQFSIHTPRCNDICG